MADSELTVDHLSEPLRARVKNDGAELTVDNLTGMFRDAITELEGEPEFQWSRDRLNYAVDGGGRPLIKIAIGNVPLDYDLWRGLRNPAVVGLYPAGLREIWDFYANRRKDKVDEYGRQTIFQVARPYESARGKCGRAVIVSAMLPLSPERLRDYNQLIPGRSSSHIFARLYKDNNLMIDRAISRVAIRLVGEGNAVVAVDNDRVNAISSEATPQTHQGASHGPSKGGNYPQKSLAVLMGLGQFGVSRIVIRDEAVGGRIQRFAGSIRSIIIFDEEAPVTDGEGGVIYPTERWRDFLFNLYDFAEADAEVNRYRFCSHLPLNDKGCGKCVESCPSRALENSSPAPDGGYPEHVARQAHRFWEGKLQFDFGRCTDERGQLAGLFPEWSCARCLTFCIAEGIRRPRAVEGFYGRMRELTRFEVE